MRRIALRPPISYFSKPRFSPSFRPTALQRFRATVASIKQDWSMVEEPKYTQSLPAAASGAYFTGSDIVEGSDSEDNLDDE